MNGHFEGCVATGWIELGAVSTRVSCNAWKLAGAATDGYYQIDPDGGGSDAPVQVYCDMSTESGGWTPCLSASSNEPLSGAINNIPDGGDWRNDVFSTSAGAAFTTARPSLLAPSGVDNTKGGAIRCSAFDATELMLVGHYSNGSSKALRGPLPTDWKTALDVQITASRYRKGGGAWTNTSSDYICFNRNGKLYESTAGNCSLKYPSGGGSTWNIGMMGTNIENGTTGCPANDVFNSCGVFLVDRQNVWSNEGDELCDHGTCGGAGWNASSSVKPTGVTVYVR